jgi:hypothetical protein
VLPIAYFSTPVTICLLLVCRAHRGTVRAD